MAVEDGLAGSSRRATTSATRQLGLALLLLGLVALVAVRGIRVHEQHSGWQGGVDFYTHWIAGVFLLQGIEPYQAYLDGATPQTPIAHADGQVSTEESFAVTADGEPVEGGRVSTSPAINTPPSILLVVPLSLFSWETAKSTIFILNLLMILLTPFLVFRMMKRRHTEASRSKELFIFLAFLGFFSVADALIVGQSAILVTFLGLLAVDLIDRDHDISGGIALGIALSKFTLMIPLLVYVLYRRRLRVAAIAGVVQVIGFLLFSFLSQTSPIKVLLSYINLLLHQFPIRYDTEIALLARLSSSPLLGGALVVVLTASVLVVVYRAHRRVVSQGTSVSIVDPLVLGLLFAWGLLATRHLAYDMLVNVVPLTALAFARSSWAETSRSTTTLFTSSTILAWGAHFLPLNSIVERMPAHLEDLTRVTGLWFWLVTNLGILVLCIWAIGVSLRQSRVAQVA